MKNKYKKLSALILILVPLYFLSIEFTFANETEEEGESHCTVSSVPSQNGGHCVPNVNVPGDKCVSYGEGPACMGTAGG